MAEYTIQLRMLLQSDFVPALDDYPIFDESYRAVLNQKILDHYYMEEIGLETPDLFNHYLKVRMSEIMPYYNEMYRTQALIANPFHNFEYSETSTRETDLDSSGVNTETTGQDSSTTFKKGKVESHSAQSDTPQSNLTPYNVATGGYASLVNMSETESEDDTTEGEITSNSSMNTANQAKTVDEYVRTITGSQGVSKPEILKQYRQAFINIDYEIIKELGDLFMIVY